jgi:hypothetical protein
VSRSGQAKFTMEPAAPGWGLALSGETTAGGTYDGVIPAGPAGMQYSLMIEVTTPAPAFAQTSDSTDPSDVTVTNDASVKWNIEFTPCPTC